MEDEQEQRRRKVEAGRAKLANFRQRKTKGDCPNSKKKTAKRKGSAVHASVQEEGSVATPNSELPQGGAVFESPSCSNTLEGTRGASAAQEQEDCELDVTDLQGQQQTQPPPPQTAHSLELEALRLSLNNMHTAQLELTQANLQKEKETALTELREMLNGRRAQELALLQSRQQCELELLREQHAREKEEMALRSGQEAAELKEKLRSEMEKNAQTIETLKQDWESERELCLENLRQELSLKHQSEMEGLQSQFQKELSEQKVELEKIFQAKHEAEVSLKNLEAQHQAAIKKLQEDLQSEHCQYLQDLEQKFREKEKAKELEVLHKKELCAPFVPVPVSRAGSPHSHCHSCCKLEPTKALSLHDCPQAGAHEEMHVRVVLQPSPPDQVYSPGLGRPTGHWQHVSLLRERQRNCPEKELEHRFLKRRP